MSGCTNIKRKNKESKSTLTSKSFHDNDRAILDGEDSGFVKVHVRKGTDKIVGATIVARNAGDLISEITLAMTHGLGLKKIGSTIHPYPTQAEAIRKLGDQFNRTRLHAVRQIDFSASGCNGRDDRMLRTACSRIRWN